MTKYLAHIADRVLNRPLMILPEKLELITEVLGGRIGLEESGLKIDVAGELVARQVESSSYVGRYEPVDASNPKGPKKPYRQTDKGVAIVDVLGSLVNRGSWLDALSGLTSYERLNHQLSFAIADDSIGAIVLDMDSPGGEAVGAFEASDAVRAAAARKPVTAIINGMAASAAYAIASGASRIITTKSGISGSIGVVMLHMDRSRQLDQRGLTPTLIHAGARKVDGNPYEKLTDEVKAELKTEIDRFYSLFVQNVAQNRPGLSEDAIRATEARTYIGADAVAAGLADDIGTFDSVVADLSGRRAMLRPSNPRGMKMTEQVTYSQAQFDTAVASARAEATTAATTAANADRDVAIAAAVTAARSEATAAERARIKGIVALEETKGREASALHLATGT